MKLINELFFFWKLFLFVIFWKNVWPYIYTQIDNFKSSFSFIWQCYTKYTTPFVWTIGFFPMLIACNVLLYGCIRVKKISEFMIFRAFLMDLTTPTDIFGLLLYTFSDDVAKKWRLYYFLLQLLKSNRRNFCRQNVLWGRSTNNFFIY